MDIRYYEANGLRYKFVQEQDGWWSIYRWHRYKLDYVPVIQSRDLEHCKSYCDLCEPVVVPLENYVKNLKLMRMIREAKMDKILMWIAIILIGISGFSIKINSFEFEWLGLLETIIRIFKYFTIH